MEYGRNGHLSQLNCILFRDGQSEIVHFTTSSAHVDTVTNIGFLESVGKITVSPIVDVLLLILSFSRNTG